MAGEREIESLDAVWPVNWHTSVHNRVSFQYFERCRCILFTCMLAFAQTCELMLAGRVTSRLGVAQFARPTAHSRPQPLRSVCIRSIASGPDSKAMIVEYIRYKLAEGKTEDFIAAYTRASGPLARSEFCKGYELAQCKEDPNVFIMRILWTSSEDHMGGFRKSAEFREFLPEIKPYIDEIEEMRHYIFTSVVSKPADG